MLTLIHLVSLALALAAAAESFFLIRLTGRSHAWLFFVMGFALLAIERSLMLLAGEPLGTKSITLDIVSDVLMMFIVAFYLYGIHRMRAVFLEHDATQKALQHELEDLKRFQRLTVGRELRMKELLQQNKAQLQHIDDLENGKPT